MIRNPPDAAALIGLAAQALEQDLACEPSRLSRYDRRLVVAALRLAARELDNGEAPMREALAALRPLMPEPPGETSLETLLTTLSRQLAAEIRAGERDGDARTHDGLLRATRAYLNESNPKALAGASSGDPRREEKPRRDDGA